jgi:four helix bundle protein
VASGEVRHYRDLLVWQKAEFVRFLSIARGSLAEVETQIIIATRLSYLDQASQTSLLDAADEISRMLAGLIAKLEERRT